MPFPNVLLRKSASAAQRATAALTRIGASSDERPEAGECMYILASPRSGTTMFHRLLSRDEARFRPLLLPETLLPSEGWGRRFGSSRPAVEAESKGIGTKLSLLADKALFGKWAHIHKVSFLEPEEDEWLWMRMGYSPAWHLLYGDPALLPEMDAVDELDDDTRQRLQAGYASMLGVLRSVEGEGRTLLMKNTLNAGRLGTVHEVTPTAKYVQLVRDPVESVVSFVSMFHSVIKAHMPQIKADSEQMHRLADLGVQMLIQIDDFLQRLPEDQRYWLRYEDLIADPAAAVETVYEHFGWSPDAAFAQTLEEQRAAQRRHRSRHRYTAEEFGLDPEDLRRRTQDICERFGYQQAGASE